MTDLINLPQIEVEIKFYLGQTAQNIIEVGKRLIQAKSLVQHGQWQTWLQNNFQLSQQTATNFMNCATRFGKIQINLDFKPTQMIALLALPDAEETKKFIEQKVAEDKEVAKMTITQLRKEIEEYKLTIEQKDKAHQQSLFDLQEQLDDTQKQLAEKPTVVEKLPDDYAQTKLDLSAAQTQTEALSKELDTAQKQIKKLKAEKKRSDDLRKQLEQIKERGIEKPDGLFDVIVIDPPWGYVRQAHHGSFDANGRRCTNPYPEMTQDELKAIELPAASDCVLFLWTTHKFIWDAKELLDHWHFDYRCMLVWNKQMLGTGNLIRMQCEFCLIGLKGKPVFKDVHNIRDLIEEPRREHSRKPDAFYQLVEELCAGRKLDYFSRQQREGWATYGNDTDKFSVA